MENWQQKHSFYLVIGLFFLYVFAYSTLTILRHERLNSTGYDLAIQDQVVWNSSQGRLFEYTLEVNNYLGDHTSFTLLLLVPLYWIWSNVKMMLIVQAVVLGSGIFPVYALAKEKLESQFWGLTFAFLYISYVPLGYINRFDYHPITFVVPAFLAAFYYLEHNKYTNCSIFLLLALLSKEQIGFTIFVFGLYMAVFRREKKFGLSWAVIGLAYSIFALFIVIPHFRGVPSDSFGRFGWLGSSAPEIIFNILHHPWDTFYDKLGWHKIYSSFIKQLPLGFLPILGLEILFIPFPEMMMNYLSYTNISPSTIYYHYFAPILPFFFIAAIWGTKRLLSSYAWLKISKKAGVNNSQKYLGLTLICLSIVTYTIENPFTKEVQMPFRAIQILRPGPSLEEFREAVQLIPADASVLTSMAFSPHLSHRQDIGIVDIDKTKNHHEYIFINVKDRRWLHTFWRNNFKEKFGEIVRRPEYGVIYYKNGVLLMKRGESNKIDKSIPLADLAQ